MKNAASTAAFAAILGLTLAHAAAAETTLTSLDGSFSFSGELQSVDNENYVIDTEFGELIIRREFVECAGDDCPDADETQTAEAGGEVTLASYDGNIRLTGELVEVTDTDYVISTGQGELTVRKEFVACEGEGCPETTVTASGFTVSVPGRFGQQILTRILTDFSTSKGYSLTQSIGAGDTLASMLIGNEAGEEVATISVAEDPKDQAIRDVLEGRSAFALTRDQIDVETLSRIAGRPIADVSDVLNEETVGLDAVTFVMNPSNQIDVIGIDQIRDVLAGSITNWSELGGKDMPIALHVLSDEGGLDAQLEDRVMAGRDIVDAATRHDAGADLNAAVMGQEGAFGVLYRSQVDGPKLASLVSQCSIYFDTSDFAVQTEEYPLVVRWYEYALKDGAAPEIAANIRDFLVTDYGQSSAASQGLVTQELRISSINEQGARLLSSVLADDATEFDGLTRDYISRVSDAKRISTSLRFLSGSDRLDTRAVGDVRRLSEIIRSPDYDGYEFVVVGFSDAKGSLRKNLSLSLARAEAVGDILLSENSGYLDPARVETVGAGPIAPVDCNDTDTGRNLNRRVEIWVRPGAKS